MLGDLGVVFPPWVAMEVAALLADDTGIDVAALAIDGARAFVKSGRDLLGRVAEKSAELAPA